MRCFLITCLVTGCFFVTFYNSCSVVEKNPKSPITREDLIYRAIDDFVCNERRLLSNDTFFHVLLDKNNPWTINIIGDQNKFPIIINIKEQDVVTIKWDADKTRMTARDTLKGSEVVYIDMSKSEEHPTIWFDPESVVISYSAFPNQVFKYRGKVFYWFDETIQSEVSPKIVDLLFNYNCVDTLVSNMYWPDSVIDDGKDMVSYFFSEKNPKRFIKKKQKGRR